MWVSALEACKRLADIMAPTLAFPAVVDSIALARRRNIEVLIFLDRAQTTTSSSANNLRVTAQLLNALGVRIRLYSARRSRSTALLTDLDFLLGSASLIPEPPIRLEQGVSIRLFDVPHQEQEELFRYLWTDAAKDWKAGSEPDRGSRPVSAPASSP